MSARLWWCAALVAVCLAAPVVGADPKWSITVLGAESDVRFPAVAEAVDFWNEQLASAHAKLRLGPIVRRGQQIPDDVLRQVAEPPYVIDGQATH